MDDNGSFDESFNFYSGAVKRLIESDDEDDLHRCMKEDVPSSIVKEDVPSSFLKEEDSITEQSIEEHEDIHEEERISIEAVSKECSDQPRTRLQKKRRAREISSSLDTQGRRRGRPQRNLRSNSGSNEENGMLNIVEINDPPTPPKATHWDELDAEEGEIICDLVKKTEDAIDKGFVEEELSTSCIDIEEDAEVAIYVKWSLKKIQSFHLKKSEQMRQIFQHLAKSEGVDDKQISLTHNGKPIFIWDTPEKIKSTVIILEGSLKPVSSNTKETPEPTDPNEIELKVLMKDKKEKISISILRTAPMETFMEQTARRLDVDRSTLIFKFDGETLDSEETPETLDMEGGECIEVFVKA